jgi:N-ethylmaleimide reductase
MASALQILSKFTIGGQELKNRIVLAPLTRARCTPTEDPNDVGNKNPNAMMGEYYAQRASAGLIISEATAISEEASGWMNAPHIRTSEQVALWKDIVDGVHAKDGLMYIQLWHMGRQSHSSFHPSTNDTVSASAIPLVTGEAKNAASENVAHETPRSMNADDIARTVQDYVKAARLSKEAGFDGLEVHAANGYLLDQFLQSSTNLRTDEYGGAMENRIRFLKEVIEALIADGAYPANRIGFRLSPNGAFGDMGSDDNDVMFPYVAKEMNKYGLAYLHMMDGLGFGFHDKCKAVTAMDIRKVFDSPMIANVGLTKEIAEGMVRSGAVDLACFGRLYISNPDLPERFANNWPVAEPAAYEHWWGATGAKGYTDFPVHTPEEPKV